MSLPPNPHRAELTEQAVRSLNLYHHFRSEYQVSFSLGQPAADGSPRINAHLERSDGVPFAEGKTPLDQKLVHLKDQTAVVKPFFLPKMTRQWDESDVNDFVAVDFDFAAILGYGPDGDGKIQLTSLYFLPVDGLLSKQSPGEDGVWRNLSLASHTASQMSLDPRKKFARFLYLAERISEGLEYQYDRYGFFYSNH